MAKETYVLQADLAEGNGFEDVRASIDINLIRRLYKDFRNDGIPARIYAMEGVA